MRKSTYPHRKIISPRQEHNTSVVLFKVCQIKVQEYIPNDEMHMQRRQINATKQTEHVDRD